MKKILIFLGIVIIIICCWYLLSHFSKEGVEIAQPINSVSYMCNEGKTIDASFYQGESKPSLSSDMPPTPGGSADIKLSDGRAMTLAQTISADGSRYANADESFVFWSKGNGALVLENNEQKSYIGCILVAKSSDANLSKAYVNSQAGFSILLPDGYTTEENYHYQELGPGKDIIGTKFTIPETVAKGTNLSNGSYISVEELSKVKSCTANLFIYGNTKEKTVTENGVDYSFASSADAAAGNRYEESVYAIPGTNPCLAIRYFIHYGAIENYTAGDIKEFDKQALLNQFDSIRKTLIINQ